MGRPRKGLRKLYRCDECGAQRFVAWVESIRASRPRCMACGSTRLNLVSEAAREDSARLQRERIAAVDSDRPSVLLAGNLRSTKKRIV